MFSVSLLYSTRDFLNLVNSPGMTVDEFKNYFQKYKYSTSEKIIEISLKCGWITVAQDGVIKISDRGNTISSWDYKKALLFQVEDLISNFNPPWGAIIQKGRTEAKQFLPADAVQCFNEAGLFDDLSDEIVHFWDQLSLAYRNYTQEKLLEIGRSGERLSLEFELSRTGRKPQWQSIESNIAGYDIISVSDKNDDKKLLIEVKATHSNSSYAKFHISRNEWNVAKSSLNYVFHLWLLQRPVNSPLIVSVGQMERHIPVDSGNGSWESTEIPFSVFL